MISEKQMIRNMTVVGVIGNIFLTTFKFLAGFLGNSAAMVTDAVHSLSDVFATAIAYIGARLGRAEADEDHQYGHERIESIASMVLGAILFVTGAIMGLEALVSIVTGTYLESEAPSMIALIAAVVSIFSKEAMFWYTMHYATLANSDAFRADAWHHRSDALSSVGALIGISLAMLGYPVADPIASFVICFFIIHVAIEIFRDSVNKVTDVACDKSYEDDLKAKVMEHDGVVRVDDLKTRLFGNMVYVDLEIAVDADITVREGHDIAEKVHDDVEESFPEVKHIMVHVNPYEKE